MDLPLNGAPSTHILKPARTGSLSSLAQNEYICMKLAKNFGLPVPEIELLNIAGKDVFVVERYDRIKKEDSMKIEYTTFSEAGTRPYNEDYIRIVEIPEQDRTLFVLCDGMGGHAMGDLASHTVGDVFAN